MCGGVFGFCVCGGSCIGTVIRLCHFDISDEHRECDLRLEAGVDCLGVVGHEWALRHEELGIGRVDVWECCRSGMESLLGGESHLVDAGFVSRDVYLASVWVTVMCECVSQDRPQDVSS